MKTTDSFVKHFAIALLFVVAIGWRLLTAWTGDIGWLPNFAPLAAIALCGAIYFPKHVALGLPLAALFASDLLLDAHYGVSLVSGEMVVRYVALALVGAIGLMLRARPQFALILGGSLLGSLLFYAITDSASWLTNPGYAKTFAGWRQALSSGIAGYPPTWMFFRNTLVSDLLFTALFLVSLAATRQREPMPAGQAEAALR